MNDLSLSLHPGLFGPDRELFLFVKNGAGYLEFQSLVLIPYRALDSTMDLPLVSANVTVYRAKVFFFYESENIRAGWFQTNGGELSITEIRTIKSKKGVSWSCRNCNILSSDINDLKAAILSLRNDLAAREKSAGIDDKAFEELLAELGDRNNRKQNIIMFGVPESDTHDANTRRSRELETVQAVLKALPSGMNTDHIEIQMLLDTDHYKKLNKDPTTKVGKQTRDAIKESSIPKEERRRLLPSESRPPRLPTIHKSGNPLRPIVSTCGSSTYELAKYVAKQLAQYSGNTKSFVKNSEHFIEILQQHEVTKEDLLVSFDVGSLFTNAPLKLFEISVSFSVYFLTQLDSLGFEPSFPIRKRETSERAK
ncbi:hypothetical protein Trydic_g918 [Trypoxylus dichotomus]